MTVSSIKNNESLKENSYPDNGFNCSNDRLGCHDYSDLYHSLNDRSLSTNETFYFEFQNLQNKLKQSQDALSEQTKEIEICQAALDEREGFLKTAYAEMDELEAQLDEQDRTIIQLQNDWQQINSATEKLCPQIEQLRQQLNISIDRFEDTKFSTQERIQNLGSQIKKCTDVISEKKAAIWQKQQEQQGTIDELMRKKELLEAEIQKKTEELAKAQRSWTNRFTLGVKWVMSWLDNRETTTQAVQELVTAKEDFEQQLISLQEQIEKAKTQNSSREEEINKLKEELKQYEVEKQSLHQELSSAENELSSLKREKQNLEKQLQDAETKLENKNKKLQYIQISYEKVWAEKESLKERLNQKTIEIESLKQENESLSIQLKEQQRIVEELQMQLSENFNLLCSDLTGKTKAEVLTLLKDREEIIQKLPVGLPINIMTSIWSDAITTVEQLKYAITVLDDEIHSPEKLQTEYLENFQIIVRDMLNNNTYWDPNLDSGFERFCKIGAGINVDYADRDITAEELLYVINQIIDGSIDTFSIENQTINDLKAKFGDDFVNQYIERQKLYIKDQFRNFCSVTHRWHESFHKVNELISSTEISVKNNILQKIGKDILTQWKNGGDIEDSLILNFINVAGSQEQAFSVLLDLEVDFVQKQVKKLKNKGIDILPIASEDGQTTIESAIEEMKNVEFSPPFVNYGSNEIPNQPITFVMNARTKLARAFDMPLYILSQNTYPSGEDDMHFEQRQILERISRESDALIRKIPFTTYLDFRSTECGLKTPESVSNGTWIANFSENQTFWAEQISMGQLLPEYFSTSSNSETLSAILQGHIFNLLLPIRNRCSNPPYFDEILACFILKPLPPELVANFYKVQRAILKGRNDLINDTELRQIFNKFKGIFFETVKDSIQDFQNAFMPGVDQGWRDFFDNAFAYQKNECDKAAHLLNNQFSLDYDILEDDNDFLV